MNSIGNAWSTRTPYLLLISGAAQVSVQPECESLSVLFARVKKKEKPLTQPEVKILGNLTRHCKSTFCFSNRRSSIPAHPFVSLRRRLRIYRVISLQLLIPIQVNDTPPTTYFLRKSGMRKKMNRNRAIAIGTATASISSATVGSLRFPVGSSVTMSSTRR